MTSEWVEYPYPKTDNYPIMAWRKSIPDRLASQARGRKWEVSVFGPKYSKKHFGKKVWIVHVDELDDGGGRFPITGLEKHDFTNIDECLRYAEKVKTLLSRLG